MSMLDDVKLALRVTGTADDVYLQRLLNSAIREYLSFVMGSVPAEMTLVDVQEDAMQGIILMIKADYDADPIQREQYRAAAISLWQPYRTALGV